MSEYDAQMVAEGIYLGSEDAGVALEQLRSRGISHVLIPANTGREAVLHPDSITYLQVYVTAEPMSDALKMMLLSVGPWFFPFIDEVLAQDKTVLVHCAAGKSRSAGVVIAYLMWKREISFDEAISLVRKARPQISTKFEEQLREWDADARPSPFAKVMFDNR